MHRSLVGVGAAIALLGAAIVAGAAPAGEADDRFDAITGPFGAFVVRPDAFGIDATRTLVEVEPLLGEVDQARALQVLTDLSFPRTAAGPQQARDDARDLVLAQLTDAGYTPEQQPITYQGGTMPNIYAELPGTECADRVLVIGAHYDSEDPVGGGSDDNASGVAGMLEIARALQDQPLPITVRFASWSYEEVGLVGAFAMAQSLEDQGRDVRGAISLEMIGYTEPDIDPLTGLPGTYLGMIADPTSAPLARAFGAAVYTYAPEFAGFGAVIDPNVLPDILRSDHAAFLASGFPALMATDTANFRNENYHQATDTPDTIDGDFLAGSTRAALAGLVTFGSVDDDLDGIADICQASAPVDPPPTTTPTSPPASGPDGASPVAGDPDYTG